LASQPWFDKLTNHGSTGSPTVVQQAHQPWFSRLTMLFRADDAEEHGLGCTDGECNKLEEKGIITTR